MIFPSDEAFHKAVHDVTMEFLRRNAPAPLPKGTSYALNTDARINALADEYLETYRKVSVRLQKN